jgi:hypothetical protein
MQKNEPQWVTLKFGATETTSMAPYNGGLSSLLRQSM